MSVLTEEVEALLYLFAAVCFILALRGLASPKSARRGNLLGALGAVVGVVTVFLAEELSNVALILIVIAVGSAISVPASRMVKMTQMPQLVALFNGVGALPLWWHTWSLVPPTPWASSSLWRSPFSWEAFPSRAPSLLLPSCRK